MSADDHPKGIKRLALLLSQCLDQLENETTSSATTTSSSTTTTTTATTTSLSDLPTTSSSVTATTTTTTTSTSLSDLPDDVLLRILGYLPSTRQAIQASLISRRWRNLWLRLSSILFPVPDLESAVRVCRERVLTLHPQQSLKESAQQKFIHRALASRPPESPQLKSIKDLRITIRHSYLRHSHQPIKSLTSLQLSQVRFDDCDVNDILSLCENLESLSLEDFDLNYSVSVIKIHLPKLKKLNLGLYNGYCKSLVIDCPNLTSLVMDHFSCGAKRIDFKNVSSLEEARIYFSSWDYKQWRMVIKSVAHVKHLSTWFKFEPKDLPNLNHFKRPLWNLKHLEIQTGYSKLEVLAMASFLQLLPNLEMLILEPFRIVRKQYCGYNSYHPEPKWEASEMEPVLKKPIHLQLPSLKLVKIKRFYAEHRGGNFHLVSTIAWRCTRTDPSRKSIEGGKFPSSTNCLA
ncbi:hypothetical protein Tsubulata_030374 [Turnera subulata]|uniref:F-box domain-containing protein n=1 Tax=Turnera subulata TaxID=218843 RepID=A0A9Q0FPE8_9ROSI|nr:hypothetical protein Tsubulata_030374 [Turnera subulata]